MRTMAKRKELENAMLLSRLDDLERLAARTRVEVDDPVVGARVAERGYAFLGAAYDRRDQRVELMFGDPTDQTQHLTRSLPRVESVQVEAGPAGRDASLRVNHGAGYTLVTFEV